MKRNNMEANAIIIGIVFGLFGGIGFGDLLYLCNKDIKIYKRED